MYFKIVTRKLQGAGKAFQFIVLAGSTSKLSHTTADYVETLSPNSMLTQQEIVNVVDKLRKLGSYGVAHSITQPDVEKKLEKLFDIVTTPEGEKLNQLPTFAALGIGSYL
jgi:hypothetical protein